MTGRSKLNRFTVGTLVLTGLAACNGQDAGPLDVDRATASATAAHSARHGDVPITPEVSRWLAGLKQATARFHDIAAAVEAGWSAQITECMELPGTGGMGYHYGNVGLIDAVAEEFAPELLVYEPQKNGRKRLVAVEYIIPFDAWTETAAPSLHGVDFHRNEVFGLWVLHAWVWKHNPAGIFADWNPNVSCAFAQ
ncbi:MAG: hypothetical protein ACREK1_03350 [Longimicrobiales bacterium]